MVAVDRVGGLRFQNGCAFNYPLLIGQSGHKVTSEVPTLTVHWVLVDSREYLEGDLISMPLLRRR
jgi:hypothetical protein